VYRKIVYAGAAFVILLSAACQDVPTIPVLSAAPELSANGGLHLGQTPFTCLLLRKIPNGFGFESRRQTVFFPRSELSPDGRTTRYSFVVANAEDWKQSADCVIPRTAAAIARTDRIFRTDRSGGERTAHGGIEGGLQLMGCVTSGLCVLDGITVTVPPSQPNDEDYETVDPWNSPYVDWWNGGGTYTGVGSYGGWTSGGDTDGDGDYADEGPITFAICVAANLGPDGWAAISGSAVIAWQLWGARADVRNAHADYKRYNDLAAIDNSGWDPAIEGLYWLRYTDAMDQEKMLWAELTVAGTYSAVRLGEAVAACSIAAAAGPV
jgi:hypothetical protein